MGKVPTSINLLEPVNEPEDIWTKAYSWVFTFGRVILISIELLVLVVFFMRFVYDRQNNDLTEAIDEKVKWIQNDTFQQEVAEYTLLDEIVVDISSLAEVQELNSLEISSVFDTIPNNLNLKRYSFNDDKISLTFSATDIAQLTEYEKQIQNNPRYTNVRKSLSKTSNSTETNFSITFELVENGEDR